MSTGDEDWLRAALRLVGVGLPPRQEAHLRYGLGKYFDDIQDYPAAFAQYRRANELAKRFAPAHDRAQLARDVSRIIDTYGADGHGRSRSGTPGAHPSVFIVGMPRSGTSLAEQILASHPSVHGAGELPFWGNALARTLRTQDGGGTDVPSLAAEYSALIAGRGAGARRVVDKMPANFLAIGLIAWALPGARIIHMRRSPLDTCLSIYFQDFEAAYSYGNDLADLSHAYGEYLRVMRHWRSFLAGSILDVAYEDLIREPERWSRAMLDFIGLAWHPGCLDFHRSDRTVATASGWQVRQPLNAASVERWRNYRGFLGPLLDLDTARA